MRGYLIGFVAAIGLMVGCGGSGAVDNPTEDFSSTVPTTTLLPTVETQDAAIPLYPSDASAQATADAGSELGTGALPALVTDSGASDTCPYDDSTCGSDTQGSKIPIAGFAEVSPGIYRGGRPSESGLQALAARGVKTVISLEQRDLLTLQSTIRKEQRITEELGMYFIQKPLSEIGAYLTDAKVDEILTILSYPVLRPVFIHSRSGRDRVGLIIGLYRVLKEGWTPEAAYKEMLEFGFQPHLVPLETRYFKHRTNMK